MLIGFDEFVAVKAILGISKPLLELFTSNCAEASGVAVPIPTCAKTSEGIHKMSKFKKRN